MKISKNLKKKKKMKNTINSFDINIGFNSKLLNIVEVKIDVKTKF